MVCGTSALFDAFPLALNLAIFSGCAALVWMAGTQLSYLIDAVAEKTKIARAFLGLILLATATELPELVTTITASWSGNGALALNNMFGGIGLQLAVLAIADIFVVRGILSSSPQKPTVVAAGMLLIIALSALLAIHVTGDIAIAFHVGIGSVMIAVFYILGMYGLHRLQGRETWSPVDIPDKKKTEDSKRHNRYDKTSLGRLAMFSLLAALFILISGVFVVQVAETLAEQTGLGSSFIGVSLLALTTSLPELSTSIAAVRVKAYTMAIMNIFGSNLIMVFLLFPADLFFQSGPILNEIDDSAAFALASGVVLTAIYCMAFLLRPKIKVMHMGIGSLSVLVCYVLSLFVLYTLK